MKEEFNNLYDACQDGGIQILNELLISIGKEEISSTY
jgi:hypothetical protein